MIEIKTAGTTLCDGLSRREILQIGGFSALGLTLPGLLRAQPAQGPTRFGQAKRAILLFMTGGPPQQDTWDLKPEATGAARGDFRPIKTNVPGIEISDHFPTLARLADKFAILRSVTHDSNIHTVGAHIMLTGNAYPKVAAGEINAAPTDFPHYGSVLAKLRPGSSRMPAFVALPQKNKNTDGTVWPGLGGGFLGAQYDPLLVTAQYKRFDSTPGAYENNAFKTPSLTLPEGLGPERLHARRQLLEGIEQAAKGAEREMAAGKLDPYREKAFDLLTSPLAQRAFNLDLEPASVQDRYGRHLFGRSCLLARRLTEAGVPLITVYWHPDGTPVAPSWDTHAEHYQNLKTHLMTPCDRACSALIEDLHQRGLLDSTLIVWMGEFGRTPQINTMGGRDHWGMVHSAMLAGGGIRGGQVYGKSDKIAAYPEEDPVTPGDLAATIYWLLGVDPHSEIVDKTGRPHPIARGEVLRAIL